MTRTFTALIAGIAIIGTASLAHAAAVWDDDGTGNSIFTDQNWNPDTVVDPGTPVGMDLTINNGDDAAIGHTQVLALGIGNTLTLNDVALGFSGASGVFLPTGGAIDAAGNQSITLNDASSLRFFWGWDNDWTINGTSVLTMGNSNTNADTGGLGKDTTVNFNGLGGSMRLLEINLTEFTAAWRAKFLVDGVAAVWGSDPTVNEKGDTILVTSDGGNGTIVTPIVGVPAPAALPAGLVALGLVASRRRRR